MGARVDRKRPQFRLAEMPNEQMTAWAQRNAVIWIDQLRPLNITYFGDYQNMSFVKSGYHEYESGLPWTFV